MKPTIQDILAKLHALRRRYLCLRLALTAAGGLAGMLLFAILFVVSDWWLGHEPWLSWTAWSLLWLFVLLLVAALWRVARHPLSDSAMAVLAERALPGVENRVVNAVQLAESGSARFGESILRERSPGLERVPARRLVGRGQMQWSLLPLGAAGLVLAALFALAPQATVRGLSRLLNPGAALPPHSMTRIIQIEPGDIRIERGQSLTVAVELGGLLPRSAELIWDRGDRRPVRREMREKEDAHQNDTARKTFQAELTNLAGPARYRILAGDAKSRWHHVEIAEIPGLDQWRATVSPPAYTQRPPFELLPTSRSMTVPEGSAITLDLSFSTPVVKIEATQGEHAVGHVADAAEPRQRHRLFLNLPPTVGGSLQLLLESATGDRNRERLPWSVAADRPPRIEFLAPAADREIPGQGGLPIIFRAEDEYGVQSVELERLFAEDHSDILGSARAEPATPIFEGRFILDLDSLRVKPGEVVALRLRAQDNCPYYPERSGHSPILNLTVAAPADDPEALALRQGQLSNALHELVQWQRASLGATSALRDLAVAGQAPAGERIDDNRQRQRRILERARELVDSEELYGEPRGLLIGLVENEMEEAVYRLATLVEPASRLPPAAVAVGLVDTTRLQRRILAVLTGLPDGLENERRHRERVDLAARLQSLVEGQKLNLEATRSLGRAGSADTPQRLAQVQDRLAADLDSFAALGRELLQREQEDRFGEVVRQVLDLFRHESLYELMIAAAESLAHAEVRAAIAQEEQALAWLAQGLDLLNDWRAERARERLAEAEKAFAEIAEALREMEEEQARIVEVTRELARRGELDEEIRRQLGEMDREQEKMGELIEQLAQDLHQFPDLPVANELNSRMLEIFEDVQQAANSENEPAIEIAVQKEDALLDSIRETRERVEDVEMWLPDVPDNIAWNMESFDVDEFPDIPLVPLPGELEDIVGELLEQAAEIDFQAQDTTGNNIIADMEMGWDIMDGPMPSFSAKGKSGNMRPNENEMTGRSGAGREGQATGELVEDRVKGLEGRETETRRTRDPFQQGMVEEETDSTLTARATGGGKLGGESETVGMFGHAPRRDLHLDPVRGDRNRLRRETEALYAAARLLYLHTGGVGLAAADLRRSVAETMEISEIDGLHRRVVRRLDNAQVEIRGNIELNMPTRKGMVSRGQAVIQDFNLEDVDEEYRDAVIEYYRHSVAP